jgi:hypothetical protein
MKRILTAYALFVLVVAIPAPGQDIKVNPDGVNVNASGATVVFLSFGPLINRSPAEGCWCGELIPAAPDIGFKCNPATVFGCLPSRMDFSTKSGSQGFTDIMSIPPSVARRAYQAAQEGATSSFFYVRRFINPSGGPDEFVAVTCRMSGGGARTPFALTDVKLSFAGDKPVMLVRAGENLPSIKAEITYNGTGRLVGRWEVVQPGDQQPDLRDLLTEASLPVEDRAMQRRYAQISRFNVFLPPGTKYVLEGPDPSRLPNTTEGPYLILLRIEESDDKEGDSNLAVVGAAGVVHSGAVAGFPLPPLRYYVGSGASGEGGKISLLTPDANGIVDSSSSVVFRWESKARAAFYRIELVGLKNQPILSALLLPGEGSYRAPSWLRERVTDGEVRWRVLALDQSGSLVDASGWRSLRLATPR